MVFFRLTTSSSAWARSGSEAHSAADASSVARNRVTVNRSNLDLDIGRQNIFMHRRAQARPPDCPCPGTPSTDGGQPLSTKIAKLPSVTAKRSAALLRKRSANFNKSDR